MKSANFSESFSNKFYMPLGNNSDDDEDDKVTKQVLTGRVSSMGSRSSFTRRSNNTFKRSMF